MTEVTYQQLTDAGLEEYLLVTSEIYKAAELCKTWQHSGKVWLISSMTDEHLVQTCKHLIDERIVYKEVSMYYLTQNATKSVIWRQLLEEVGPLSPLENIVRLPTFVRICSELISRGFSLQDVFHGRVN